MSHGPYPGFPRSAFRAVGHCQRDFDRDQRWPPRGWTHIGLDAHRRTVARALALLIAYADPDIREDRIRHAREMELRSLAGNLTGALETVLWAIGDHDTHQLDMRDERGKDSA